ncbi:transcriptional regulator [Subtercola boreus]|uniref:Transcriptional regulator n=1 Tax=Subtercola boreus TaxID=120213 RepID=A0A3E0VMC5_9MICO|nr:winged helix-turn-helix domain-containing protein [Subtercola boreus]RFA11036.1 transcriptional regulator [Subtercola boreus]
MSIAHLTSPRTTSYVAPAETPVIHAAPAPVAAAPSHIRAVPAGTEARGFVVYVGIDEEKAEADGTSLGSIVSQIKALVAQLAPSSETYAAVALAPRGSGGRDVEVVRLALQDPAALAKHRQTTEPEAEADRARDGVVIDLSRKRVLLDNEAANLTYKEFELLQYLVLREGRTIERAELISSLWGAGHEDLDDIPNERTIDVHVRRLRAKLGDYEDIVRTVRGVGYRFDRHADVSVRQTSTPSPDLI